MARWLIVEEEEGDFSVFRGGKVVRYHCSDLEEAVRAIKRKKPPAGTKIQIEHKDGGTATVTVG